MARQYNPQRFFRQAPNNLLAQYFKEKGTLAEIKFEEFTETKIETVYEAWPALYPQIFISIDINRLRMSDNNTMPVSLYTKTGTYVLISFGVSTYG